VRQREHEEEWRSLRPAAFTNGKNSDGGGHPARLLILTYVESPHDEKVFLHQWLDAAFD
jgi:hypothetical protein